MAAFFSALSNEGKSHIFNQTILCENYDMFENIVKRLSCAIGEYNIQGSIEYFVNLLPNYYIELDNSQINLKFQVQMFHTKSGNFIASIPKEFDSKLRQIYLATDSYDPEKQIFFLIPKLKSFYKKFGHYCVFCRKIFTSRGCIHKCSKIPSCFCCHRPYLEIETYVTYETSDYFCNGLLTPSPSSTCQKCNVTYYSSNCYEKHRSKVCKHGWKCPSCKIFQSCNKFYKSQEDVKKKHCCHQRTCNFCGKVKEIPHFCTLKQVPETKEFTNLAFVSFYYSGYNVSKCKECFILENRPCLNCLDELESPICCAILQEEKNRNSFSLKYILETKMEKEMTNFTSFFPKEFQFAYIPYFVQKHPNLAPEGRKTHFGQRQKRSQKYTNAFSTPDMTFMQMFFDYLMKNNFSNSTILVYSGINRDMFYILQGLLHNGFSPKVIKHHNQIMLIEDNFLGLRFVEIQNYLNCTFKEMCVRIGKNQPFFPLSWLQPKFYKYSGKPPTIDDYFNFEDSKSDIEEKKNLIQTFQGTWNFQSELLQYIGKVIKILAHVFLDFLKETFYCQQILLYNLNIDENLETFLHPLNSPIFTAGTYAFQLFLKYSEHSKNITTVNNPIPFKSSRGEIEYIEYVKWQNPNLKLEYAWSPSGQRDLYYSKPDAYSETDSTLWYYHGCFFHSHHTDKCFFKRKTSNNLAAIEEERKFKKKLWLIKENHKVENVVIMWECVWRHMKKNNTNVKYFMQNIFQNPPMHRLQPRDAGKYTYFEIFRL